MYKIKYYAFRARLYRQNEDRPFFSNIMIQDTAPKLKQTHSAFGYLFPKSYIYDYRVLILEGRKSHEFQISCKNAKGLEGLDMSGKDTGRADYTVKQ